MPSLLILVYITMLQVSYKTLDRDFFDETDYRIRPQAIVD